MQDNLERENDKNKENESINFKLIFDYLYSKKRLFIIIFFFCFSGIFLASTIQKSRNIKYAGSFQLLIEDPISSKDLNSKSGSASTGFPGYITSSDIFTLSSFLKSDLVLGNLSEKYKSYTSDIKDMITITRGGPGNNADGILVIRLELEDKLLGSKLISDLAQTYVDAARHYREKKLQEGIEFINQTKPSFEEELEKLDKKYRYFEEKYVLIQEGTRFPGTALDITNLVSKVDQIKSKLNYTSEENSELLAYLGNNSLNINNEKAKELIKKYSLLDQINLSNEDYFLTNKKLISNIKKRINKNNKTINYLKKQIKEINFEFDNPELLTRSIYKLLEEINLVKEALNNLSSSSELFKIQIAQNATPWNIIEKPYMGTEPVTRPFLNEFLIISSMSAFFSLLFIITIILIEDKFANNNQIIDFSGLKIIGRLPKIDQDFYQKLKDNQFIDKDFKNMDKLNNKLLDFENYFFSFCSTLQELKNKDNSLIFLISSPFNSNNTFIDFYTSKFFSSIGEKTLLIDTNFDEYKMNEIIENKNSVGLFDYLSNSQINCEEILSHSKINSNLDIVHQGDAAKNNSLLILSKRMEELLEKLKQKYSYIFIKSQNLHNAETVSISKLADLTIIEFDKNKITKTNFKSLLVKLNDHLDSINLLINY